MPDSSPPVFFSIAVPAFRECPIIAETCSEIFKAFDEEGLHDIEILVIDDNSQDGTDVVLQKLAHREPRIRPILNTKRRGFGASLVQAFDAFQGDAICITMADLSDSPADLVSYYRLMRDGEECVFGSRFIKGGQALNYPRIKLIVNRFVNWVLQVLFWIPLNDVTGACKCYRRNVVDGVRPILSKHFSITVEMPLKAIVRGYRYRVIPITWTNRRENFSNLSLTRQSPRYLYAVLCVWLERLLVAADYRREDQPAWRKCTR
jgi:dolichol-phosphate mannosyltransferase